MVQVEYNNKYYTPSIEEFHVGFEYEEEYIETHNGVREFLWSKEVYNLDHFLNVGFDGEYYFDSIDKTIRVKYLDKEDIESLGFIYKGTRNYHTRNGIEESGFLKKLEDDSNVYIKCFLDKDDKVDSPLDITSTDIYTYDTSTPWDAYCEGGCGPGCWQIKIKNKSELKVLLKQLNLWAD